MKPVLSSCIYGSLNKIFSGGFVVAHTFGIITHVSGIIMYQLRKYHLKNS